MCGMEEIAQLLPVQPLGPKWDSWLSSIFCSAFLVHHTSLSLLIPPYYSIPFMGADVLFYLGEHKINHCNEYLIIQLNSFFSPGGGGVIKLASKLY